MNSNKTPSTIDIDGSLLNLRDIAWISNTHIMYAGEALEVSTPERVQLLKNAKAAYEDSIVVHAAEAKLKDTIQQEITKFVKDRLQVEISAMLENLQNNILKNLGEIKRTQVELDSQSRDLQKKIGNMSEVDFDSINESFRKLQKITKTFESIL